MVEELQFCGVPDHVAHVKAGWGVRPIRWTITDSLPGVPDEVLRSVTAQCLADWAAVADLEFAYTDIAATANILVTCRSIDGPSNVLAETELPYGQKQVHLWFDLEKWRARGQPGPGEFLLPNVDAHELGHALGLGHITADKALMNPIYDPAVNKPLAADIQAIQGIYGKPRLTPTPAPSPAPTPGGSMQNWLVQMAIAALKSWIQAKIADGSLITLLTDLLSKLNTGQITTADQFEAHVEQLVAAP